MKQLEHPNIITFHDIFEDSLNMYIVMQLCTGGELFERIERKGTYKENDARIVIKQMLEAIAYLHDKGIAHCDLKPENFLFLEDDQDKKVNNPKSNQLLLIDFGLSKHMTNRREYLTRFCGTSYYVAPEVINGKYNRCSDLWSVGVIIFILFYGYPPFYADPKKYQNKTDLVIHRKILKGFNPIIKDGYGAYFPKKYPISDSAKDLIKCLLTKDIGRRLTAREALNHPFITATNDLKLDSFVLTSMKGFSATKKLQLNILKIMTKYLKEDETKALKETFQSIDNDNSGNITFDNLKQALLHEDGIENGNEIEAIFNSVDVSGDGVIKYEELLLAYVHSKLTAKEERLFEVFVALDVTESGTLTKSELANALKISDFDIPTDKITEMINEADIDGDGQINYEEFLNIMWFHHSKPNLQIN